MFLPHPLASLALSLAALASASGAEASPSGPPAVPTHIVVDITAAPECEAFATKAKDIAEEWYPKIEAILFGPGHALPVDVVQLKFETMKGVAHATGGSIHISAEWVTKKAPNDYGMVVHELTHIVQDYHRGNKVDGWVTEGIADYVRHQHFEKDPEVITKRIDPEKAHYTNSYTVTAAFFIWLEVSKNKDFVRQLNVACQEGRYQVALFQELCGAPVDELWKEFVVSLRAARPGK